MTDGSAGISQHLLFNIRTAKQKIKLKKTFFALYPKKKKKTADRANNELKITIEISDLSQR